MKVLEVDAPQQGAAKDARSSQAASDTRQQRASPGTPPPPFVVRDIALTSLSPIFPFRFPSNQTRNRHAAAIYSSIQ